jgi:hypothetical protein
MSPEAGKQVTLVPPTAPAEALDAATAELGSATEVQREAGERSSAEYASVQIKPFKPPETQAEKEKKTAWIEVEMVGEDDKPIPGVRYRVTLPDGTVDEGTLGSNGLVRVDGFEPGTCKISFPELDEEAWKEL